MHKLAANQDTLMHVVEKSISVLNVSRMEIKENRQRLNDLLLLIGSVEDKFINNSDQLEKEITEVNTALILFSRLNTLIGELKLALSRSMYFYVHFKCRFRQLQCRNCHQRQFLQSVYPICCLKSKTSCRKQ